MCPCVCVLACAKMCVCFCEPACVCASAPVCKIKARCAHSQVVARQFETGWGRVVPKSNFRRMVTRQDKGALSDQAQLQRELDEVRCVRVVCVCECVCTCVCDVSLHAGSGGTKQQADALLSGAGTQQDKGAPHDRGAA